MSADETRPLLPTSRGSLGPFGAEREEDEGEGESSSFKGRLGRTLESDRAHWVVIGLTALDATFVISDIAWDFLKDPSCICDHSCPEDPPILEVFSMISLAITSVFLLEIPASLYAFGHRHYTTAEHAYLHLFDACVITATFMLEVFLRGREAEVAGLLVLLRLWRIAKLVSTVSVGVTELDEVHTPALLEEHKARWTKEKQELLAELERVKQELDTVTQMTNALE